MNKSPAKAGRRYSQCKECRATYFKAAREKLRETSPFKLKHKSLKSSATTRKVKYNLDPEYLESIWTGKCAIFGTAISLSSDGERPTAEIDKINPELGYIKGNVAWVCHKANRVKSDATLDELKRIIKFMENYYERNSS